MKSPMFCQPLLSGCVLVVIVITVNCLPSLTPPSDASTPHLSPFLPSSKLSPVSSVVPHESSGDHLLNVTPAAGVASSLSSASASAPSSSSLGGAALKSLVKKRLRPGIGLGRGLVKATINTAKRARSALINVKDDKASRQAPGLMAGAIAYGLASLPFLTLPLLIASPLAISRVFKSEILKNHVDQNSSSSQTAAKIAQALGLHPVTLDDDKVYPISPGSNIGDALFHPGSFAGSGYSHPKYKQYVFKQGLLTTTPKPAAAREDGGKMTMGKAKSLDSSDGHEDLMSLDAEESTTTTPRTPTKGATKTSSKGKENISLIAKEVLRTVSDGIKKFELEKSECKERLVCEVSQKYAGSSFKSWATALTHVLDLDSKVEKSKVGKNVLLRSLYRGARSSLSDRNCAELFPNCS